MYSYINKQIQLYFSYEICTFSSVRLDWYNTD